MSEQKLCERCKRPVDIESDDVFATRPSLDAPERFYCNLFCVTGGKGIDLTRAQPHFES